MMRPASRPICVRTSSLKNLPQVQRNALYQTALQSVNQTAIVSKQDFIGFQATPFFEQSPSPPRSYEHRHVMRQRDLLAHDADVSRRELESQANVFALELLVERDGRPALRLDLDRHDASVPLDEEVDLREVGARHVVERPVSAADELAHDRVLVDAALREPLERVVD